MRTGAMRRITWGLTLSAALVEIPHRFASRRGLHGAGTAPRRSRPGDQETEAIIVLGYPPRKKGKTHPLQRWRCQIAVRSINPDRTSTLIMTGAPTNGEHSEARVMAAYTRDVLGVPGERIVLEEQARSTWENMEFALPLAETHDFIKIASDPLHALRARRYLGQIRPDLPGRLEAADDYHAGEHPLLKAATLAYEGLLWGRDRIHYRRDRSEEELS